MGQLSFPEFGALTEQSSTPQKEPQLIPDTAVARKSRGAFFTPPELVSFLTKWAVRDRNDRVLEPACGEAVFLLEAARQLRLHGATAKEITVQLKGIEFHGPSAKNAATILAKHDVSAEIRTGNFFDEEPLNEYDAVIGNPPYVRYQDFAGAARAKGLEAALRQGVRLTGLTNSWAAFVVHASEFLKPSGRLALVLPAELLSVNYAAQVRRFLLERFASVRLVTFEELVFPGVLEEVVLLLAEGTGPAPSFEVHQTRDLDTLLENQTPDWFGFSPQRDGKWTPALLPGSVQADFEKVVSSEGFAKLLQWGETRLGAVTGNNKYFTLTAAEAAEHAIPSRELRPISPPGSRHLRGLSFTESAWEEGARDGAASYLFVPDPARPSAAARAYIDAGKARGVDSAYKCRNRQPWWRVPLVRVPDLFMTYMDHERPRLVANEAHALHLNSLYGLTLRHGLKELGRDLLPIAILNTVTLLSAEIAGRSYGGGLLKLEPTEADNWQVPSEHLLREAARDLRALRPQLAQSLRNNDVTSAVQLVDRELLSKRLGISSKVLLELRTARQMLFSRRISRGKGIRVKS